MLLTLCLRLKGLSWPSGALEVSDVYIHILKHIYIYMDIWFSVGFPGRSRHITIMLRTTVLDGELQVKSFDFKSKRVR